MLLWAYCPNADYLGVVELENEPNFRWLRDWERIERFKDTIAVSTPYHGQQIFPPR